MKGKSEHKNVGRRSGKRRTSRQFIIPLVAIIFFGLLAALVALFLGQRSPAPIVASAREGTLVAGVTRHDFGQVSMRNGLVAARFPLTVDDSPVTVAGLGTT